MRPKNWFNCAGRKRNFKRAFGMLAGKPATYLEIGVFRGDSLRWMLSNVLRNPESRAIGIDPWQAKLMGHPWTQAECDENMALAQQAVAEFSANVTLVRTTSQEWFAEHRDSGLQFDAIYLDGQHDREPLGADFRAAWPFLKVGGSIILDDYGARNSTMRELVDEDLAPVYAADWCELFRNYQIGFLKVRA